MDRADEQLQYRKALERLVGRRVPDQIWEYWRCDGTLGWVNGAADVEPVLLPAFEHAVQSGLVDAVSAGLTYTARLPRPDALREQTPSGDALRSQAIRRQAVAAVLAAEGDQDEEVIAFRARELDGQLLSPGDLELWLENRAGPEQDRTRRWFLYTAPGLNRPRRLSFAPTSPLGDLWRIARRLQARFGWRASAAVTFILTGLPPVVSLAQAGTIEHGEAKWLRLELSPALSADEVRDYYMRVRERFFPGRHRSLSAKHLHLAAWYAAHGHEPSLGMKQWNATVPDAKWRYSHSGQFGRDCRCAYERLFRDWGGIRSEQTSTSPRSGLRNKRRRAAGRQGVRN